MNTGKVITFSILLFVLNLVMMMIIIFDSNDKKIELFSTFSKTQVLGNEYKQIYKNGLNKDLNKIFSKLPRVDFPSATSSKDEIKILLDYQKNKDLELHKKQALKEIDIGNDFNDLKVDYGDIFKIKQFFNNIAEPLIFKLKVDYDRIRPTFFDKRVKAIIEVPNHPSYPSGHAFQSYAVAYLLMEKYPEKKDIYLKYAERVSKNREIMGLHYPSDSEYGKLLASEIIKLSKYKI